MKRSRLPIHIALLLFFGFLPGLRSATSDSDLPGLLKQSMQNVREIPFEGVLSFYRKLSTEGSEHFVSKVNICRATPDYKRMEVLEPEILKNHTVAKIGENIWVTPLSEEIRKSLPPEIRFHHWFRIFHDLTGALDLHHFDLLLENYNIIGEKNDIVSDRPTVVIYIQSKHLGKNRKRPSVRFWIDKETRMPLKSQFFNCNDDSVETIQFKQIRLGLENVRCVIQTEGLIKLTPPPGPDRSQEEKELNFCPLILERIPRGFKEIFTHTFERQEGIIYETAYTDGLTKLSTFQRLHTREEKEELSREPEEERSKVKKFKDRNIFYRDVEGIRIVAMGELDEGAINFVLHNMKLQPPDSPKSTQR